MRRSYARYRGKNFYAAGWGKRGPYVVATRRIARRTYAKASAGLSGVSVGLKYSGRRSSVQGMVNLSSGEPSVSHKRKG